MYLTNKSKLTGFKKTAQSRKMIIGQRLIGAGCYLMIQEHANVYFKTVQELLAHHSWRKDFSSEDCLIIEAIALEERLLKTYRKHFKSKVEDCDN